jgi:hypothetical protein
MAQMPVMSQADLAADADVGRLRPQVQVVLAGSPLYDLAVFSGYIQPDTRALINDFNWMWVTKRSVTLVQLSRSRPMLP